MSPQRNRWKTVREILFYPWIILLLIATLILTSILLNQTNAIVIATSAFLISLFSGVLGGIVVKRLDITTEEKLIAAKGNSAYSDLQLLLSSVISLERRVRLYLQRLNNKEYSKRINPEVINTYFEEVVEECISLEEKVIKSIDYWADVLPDVDIKPVLNLIRELKIDFYEKSTHLEKLNIELRNKQNKTKEEISELNMGRMEIAEELKRLKKELQKNSTLTGISAISESLITGENYSPTTDENPKISESSPKVMNDFREEQNSNKKEIDLPKENIPVNGSSRQTRKRKYKEDIFAIFRDGNR